MSDFKKSINVFIYNFKINIFSYRILVVMVIIGVFILNSEKSIIQFTKITEIKSTPWIFPHLTNDYIAQIFFMIDAIVIFCDAPFIKETYEYILPKSGINPWVTGGILYVVFVSFLYTSYILIMSIVVMIPYLEWSTSWGKILGTLARTDAPTLVGMSFSINDLLIGFYSPIIATLLSFYLEWLCVLFIGMVIYTLNNFTKQIIGTIIAGGIILIDVMVANEWIPKGYKMSPITLSQLSSFSGENLLYGITLKYAILFFTISFFAFAIWNYIYQNATNGNFKKIFNIGETK